MKFEVELPLTKAKPYLFFICFHSRRRTPNLKMKKQGKIRRNFDFKNQMTWKFTSKTKTSPLVPRSQLSPINISPKKNPQLYYTFLNNSQKEELTWQTKKDGSPSNPKKETKLEKSGKETNK